MFQAGQGIYGRIRFTDGTLPDYDRAYLVVTVSNDRIGVLNVSSVAGKESKLLYPTNKLINKYFPPFPKRSFVKLDSLVYVSVSEMSNIRTLSNGDLMDPAELNSILKELNLVSA